MTFHINDQRFPARFPCVLVILAATLGVSLRLYGQTCGVNSKMQKDVQKLVQVDDAHLVRRAVQQFIEQWGSGAFRSVRHHTDLGVSLRAAWEEVLITIPEQPPPGGTFKVDRGRLQWFAGFLEGRLRTKPPDWWSHGLLRAEAIRRCNVVFHELEESACHTTVRELDVPRNTSIENLGQKVRLSVGNQSITIPTETFERLVPPESEFNHIGALLSPERCYLAVHTGIVLQKGSLYCIERDTGKTRWESELWAGCIGSAYSSVAGFHCVDVVDSSGRIFVFGMAGGAAYVEAFNPDDGKNLFRFATDR
jgi:hypothetical protein